MPFQGMNAGSNPAGVAIWRLTGHYRPSSNGTRDDDATTEPPRRRNHAALRPSLTTIAVVVALAYLSGVGCGPKSSGTGDDGGASDASDSGGTDGDDSATGTDAGACPSPADQPVSNAPCTSPRLACQYRSAFCTCTTTNSAVVWSCQPII
jgi:hypothetical protein